MIDKGRVTLRKGAANGILTGQADIKAFFDQRGKGQMLTRRPVNIVAGIYHLTTTFDDTSQGFVHIDPSGDFGHLLT